MCRARAERGRFRQGRAIARSGASGKARAAACSSGAAGRGVVACVRRDAAPRGGRVQDELWRVGEDERGAAGQVRAPLACRARERGAWRGAAAGLAGNVANGL